jgi:hypothetical protein
LLVAIVSMEVHEVLAAGERVIADPPRNAEKAVAKLISNYIEHALVYLSKEMWRQAMAITTQQPDSPSGVAYNELDEALARQTAKLIRKLQTLGLVQVGVDAQAIGEMIFNTNMMSRSSKQEAMSVATCWPASGARTDLQAIAHSEAPARSVETAFPSQLDVGAALLTSAAFWRPCRAWWGGAVGTWERRGSSRPGGRGSARLRSIAGLIDYQHSRPGHVAAGDPDHALTSGGRLGEPDIKRSSTAVDTLPTFGHLPGGARSVLCSVSSNAMERVIWIMAQLR